MFTRADELDGACDRIQRAVFRSRLLGLVLYPDASEESAVLRSLVEYKAGLALAFWINLDERLTLVERTELTDQCRRFLCEPNFGAVVAMAEPFGTYEQRACERIDQWAAAGEVAIAMLSLHEFHTDELHAPPTVDDVAHLLAHLAKQKGSDVDPGEILDIWRQAQPIAHFIGAFNQMRLSYGHELRLPPDDLVLPFLSVARRLQRFFTDEGGGISAADLWTIPDGDLALLPWELRPFKRDAIAWLNAHQRANRSGGGTLH